MTIERPSAARASPAVAVRWIPAAGTAATIATVDAGYERQTLSVGLPCPPAVATALELEFQDDAGDPPSGFLHLYALRLSCGAPGGETVVVASLDGETAVAAGTLQRDLVFHTASLGSVFLLRGPRPAIELAVPPERTSQPAAGWRLELTLRVPRSVDYLLARDHYLLREEELERRLHDAEEELRQARARLTYLSEFHDLIQRSWTWRSVRGLVWLPHYLFRVPWSVLRTGARLYRQGGAAAVHGGIRDWAAKRRARVPTEYEAWRKKKAMSEPAPAVAQADGPLFSIVLPASGAEPGLLEEAVASVTAQTYPNWELCVGHDAATPDGFRHVVADRLQLVHLERTAGVAEAANRAAAAARGDYLAFLQPEDALDPRALGELAAEIARNEPDIVYTDEDSIDAGGRLDSPHFKPDYNPDLLLAHNYVGRLLAVRSALFREVGGFSARFEGAEEYDLLLRLVERTNEIRHVARPLYHRRRAAQAADDTPGAAMAAHASAGRALSEALARRGIAGAVEDGGAPQCFRVRRRIAGAPLVSIVVPFRDRPGLLRTCLESLLERTDYARFEVVGVSNDTTSASAWDLMRELRQRDARVRFVEANQPFNFSRLVNLGVAESRGEHVVLLNNDIEITEPGWLAALLEHSQRAEVAAVGGMLTFPDGTVQHAGIVVGLGGHAGYPHRRFPAGAPGYFNRLGLTQNVSAVTAAMLMVKRRVYTELGGFDEADFAVAYNDVDFCLRARARGYLNVYTPYARALHAESRSRGYELSAEQRRRFAGEQANLQRRHGAVIRHGDPYFNPNFDPGRDDFRLAS